MSEISEIDKAPLHPPSIIEIFWVFFRIGAMSFGGGVSGWIYREVVVHRGWLTENEFMSNLATSQILPGSNIANLAITLAYKLRGTWGSCVALLALMSGPFFGVLALAAVYSQLQSLTYSQAVIDGIAAAAIGLSVIVAFRGVRRAAARPEALIALFATFIGVGLLHWSMLLVVLVVGSISVAIAWRKAANEG